MKLIITTSDGEVLEKIEDLEDYDLDSRLLHKERLVSIIQDAIKRGLPFEEPDEVGGKNG